MEKINNLETVFKVAEIQMIYRSKVKPSERPCVKRPNDAYKIFLQTWDTDKIEYVEEFKVMLLNRSNKVLGICTLTSGCLGGTVADPKMVFAAALKANASRVIIAHNHPSGNIEPSETDKKMTAKIKEAGIHLDLLCTDHIIVTTENYFSFAEEGLL